MATTRAPRIIRARGVQRRLSPRAEQLAVLLAKGATYKECATAMGIKDASIHCMASSVYNTLHVANRTELRAWWLHREFAKWRSKYEHMVPAEAMADLRAMLEAPRPERWLE
jgi:DNA-binding NarL/FixJ family response regulator